MKATTDNKPNESTPISLQGDHWQCNTKGNRSAHNFNTHPKLFPKDKEIKANGCMCVFPSK